ncbi:MAG: hypothetical protein HZC41_21850 [Chloroflexi bacterium]|nr:hypothetical protein [Chloroflexota bacterium]
MWKLLIRMGLVTIVLLILASTTLGQTDIPAVAVTLSANGLAAPGTLPKGLVTVNFENTSEAPFIGVLLRLNDGVDLEQLFAAVAEDPLGMLPLVSLRGGPAIMPGQTGSITYNLDAGQYVLANFAGEPPQIAPIIVEGTGAASADAPAADLNVVMVDFGYGLPLTIPAGESLWRIENAGEQWHELALAPIEPGTTVEDVQALLAQGEESGLQQLPVLMPMDAGEAVHLTMNLQPGRYAIICNLPDLLNPDAMRSHHELGMIQLITVADTLTYTDPAGIFALDYPAALAAVRPDLPRTLGLPFPGVGFGDSDATIDLSAASQPVPEGSWGIGVMFIPAAFFTQMGLPADASLSDLAMVFAPEPNNAEGAEVIGMSEITLPNGTTAVQRIVAGVTEDNVSLFYEVADGVYVLAALLSSPGGRTDAMVETFMLTVNSIEFTATADTLMAAMSGE